MGLVSAKEIAKVIHVDNYGFLGTFIGWILLKTLRISKLNEIYNKHKEKQDIEFLNAILNEVEIQFEIPDEDLKRIPKRGSVYYRFEPSIRRYRRNFIVKAFSRETPRF